MMLLNLKRIPG